MDGASGGYPRSSAAPARRRGPISLGREADIVGEGVGEGGQYRWGGMPVGRRPILLGREAHSVSGADPRRWGREAPISETHQMRCPAPSPPPLCAQAEHR